MDAELDMAALSANSSLGVDAIFPELCPLNVHETCLCKDWFPGVIFCKMSRIRFRIVPPVDRSSEGVFISGSHEAFGVLGPSAGSASELGTPFPHG
jgi:hypothetical protein